MNDETPDTLKLPSFEEKVLSQLESLDNRLASLEKREEERAYDTKPIWNRVLTEISEVNTKVSELDTKVSELDTKVSKLDERMRSVDRKLDVMNKDLLQVRSDLYGREMR